MGYVKLHDGILTSSVWAEPASTRLMWITILLRANASGEVRDSLPGLAHLARVPIPDAEAAMETFLSPDPYSRAKDHDGRRLEVILGGWRVINFATYRYRLSPEDVRAQAAARQSRARDRKPGTDFSNVTHQSVTSVTERDTPLRERDAYASASVFQLRDLANTEDLSRVRARVAEDVPFDYVAALAELTRRYPAQAVTSGYLTEQGFVSAIESVEGDAPRIFALMLANLETQKAGHQWRVKRMIPALHRWLREGLWQQRHDAHAATDAHKATRATASGAQAFVGGEDSDEGE